MRPDQVACPKDNRAPDEPCDWSDWPYAQPHPEFNRERVTMASGEDSNADGGSGEVPVQR